MAESVKYDRQIFAANLRRMMDRKGERQVDIARLLGVSRSTVSAYCNGEQMPRMDKLELLAKHFGVALSSLIENAGLAAWNRFNGPAAPHESLDGEPRHPGRMDAHLAEGEPEYPLSPIEILYRSLNDKGREELLNYARHMAADPAYVQEDRRHPMGFIKLFTVPAAAGYAAPIQGEDYVLHPRSPQTPPLADFALYVQGDSMEPHIRDGEIVYVSRGAELQPFDVGIFLVDGEVFCKQWCQDYNGTLHLLSANPRRQDANISLPADSGRSVVCFGKVLLPYRVPKPGYF